MRPRTIERAFKIERRPHGEKHMEEALPNQKPGPMVESGRVARVSRWMALALRFDDLIQRGEIESYSNLADLGHVTRARITQIMNLLNLAPDLQEALLFLPRIQEGRDPVTLGQLQAIALEPLWHKQRRMWRWQLQERNRLANQGAESAEGGQFVPKSRSQKC